MTSLHGALPQKLGVSFHCFSEFYCFVLGEEPALGPKAKKEESVQNRADEKKDDRAAQKKDVKAPLAPKRFSHQPIDSDISSDLMKDDEPVKE